VSRAVVEELEKRHRQLKAGLDAGELDPENYKKQVAELRFTDEEGRTWALNEAGRWFTYEDGRWVEAAHPVDKVHRGWPTALTWGLVAAVGVVAVAAVAIWLLVLGPSEQPPTSPSATPPAVVAATDATRPPTASPPGSDVALLVAQADALAVNSRFDEAWPLYAQAAAEAVADPLPLLSWARALAYDWQLDAALEKAEASVEVEPNSALASTVLARVHLWLGHTEPALQAATKAVGLDPDSATARALLTEAQAAAGQFLDAGANSEMALTLGPDSATAHHARSVILWLDGAPSLALSEIERAVELEPNLWLRHQQAGELCLRVSAYETALAHFQAALALRPKPQSYVGAGAAQYHQAQYEAALEMLQRAPAADYSSDDLDRYMGATLAQLDRCDDAVPYLQRAAAHSPDARVVSDGLARCQLVVLTATPPPSPEPTTTRALVQATPTPRTPGTTPTRARASATAAPLATPTATRSATPPQPTALSGWIAFPLWNASSGKSDVWIARWDGSDRHLVAEGVHQPALHPSGGLLAVNGERAGFEFLCLVQPDGSALREVTSHVEDGVPDWTRDGKRLVFGSTMHGDKQPRIYFIDDVPLGGGRVEGRVLRWEGGGEIRGEHPAWLPDGRIVFQACDPRDPGRCGLFVAGSGSEPQAAVQISGHPSDTAPAARGNWIVFMSERSGNWDLYSVSVGGGTPTRLTSSDAIEGLPAWSPDGRWIAYVSTYEGAWSVWAIRRDGSGRRKLFDLGGTPGADWTEEQISWGP
jgi:tetratricopeptide (TPR) repeat protein